MSETARRLAIEALQKHPDDQDAACKLVLKRIGADKLDLPDEVAEAVHDGVHTWIRLARSDARERGVRAVFSGEPMPMANADNASGLRIHTMTIMESWTLWHGKRLGDATAPDLAASVATRRNTAATQTARADFEEAICKALTRMKKATVRDGFTAADLARLVRKHMEVEADAAD